MAKAPLRSGPKPRRHGFIGHIYEVTSDKVGFISPGDFWREDGGDIGLAVDDDIFVHLGAFQMMEAFGYKTPDALHVGMEIRFLLGPSRNREGRTTAEFCTVYERD